MTLYAGEQVRVSSTAEDFGGVAVTSVDVQYLKITITDSAGTILVNGASMTYAAGAWSYLWTSAATPGDYWAKVVLTALDGGASVEWKRIRLYPAPT